MLFWVLLVLFLPLATCKCEMFEQINSDLIWWDRPEWPMDTADMSLLIDSTRLLARCWCNMPPPGLLTLLPPTEESDIPTHRHIHTHTPDWTQHHCHTHTQVGPCTSNNYKCGKAQTISQIVNECSLTMLSDSGPQTSFCQWWCI